MPPRPQSSNPQTQRPFITNAAASPIDEAAALWVARGSGYAMSDEDKAALEMWLAEDRRHAGAYMRAQAAFEVLKRARSHAVSKPEKSSQTPAMMDRRRLMGSGLVAACMGALGVGLWAKGQQSLTTQLGEMRKVPLKDRSVVSLNTATQLDVNLSETARRIDLIKGEAWFEVAKNPNAPFVVEAGDVRVRAVGTAFSVRKRDGGADVLVTEGVVEVWSVRAEQGAEKTRMVAGQSAFVPEAMPILAVRTEPETVERKLAWRERQIILDDITLAEAAAEFNRYNQVQIDILDPELARARLVGGFGLDHPESLAEAVRTAFNVPVSVGPDHIRLGEIPQEHARPQATADDGARSTR